MGIFRHLLLPCLFLSFGTQGFAAGKLSACPSAKELIRHLKGCDQNHLAARASGSCLESLNAEIEVERARLAGLMRQRAAAEAGGQQAGLAELKAGVADTRFALNALIARAEALRVELGAFQEMVALPGGMSRKQARAEGLTEVMEAFPCFALTRNILRFDLRDLDQKVTELKASESAVVTIGNRASTAQGRLDGSLAETSLLRGLEAIPVRSRARENGASDITGGLAREEFSSAEPGQGAGDARPPDTRRLGVSAGGASPGGGLARAGGVDVPGGAAGRETREPAGERRLLHSFLRSAWESSGRPGGAEGFVAAATEDRGNSEVAGELRMPASGAGSSEEGATLLGIGDGLAETEESADSASERTLFQRVHVAHERVQRQWR